MPAADPMNPPTAVDVRRTRSGIRHIPFTAFHLSSAYYMVERSTNPYKCKRDHSHYKVVHTEVQSPTPVHYRCKRRIGLRQEMVVYSI